MNTSFVAYKILVQFSSVAHSCLILCDSMDCSRHAHHQLLEFTQTQVHWVIDTIQPSRPLSSPSPSTFNLSQYQGLFKWVSSSHQVVKVLEFREPYWRKTMQNNECNCRCKIDHLFDKKIHHYKLKFHKYNKMHKTIFYWVNLYISLY